MKIQYVGEGTIGIEGAGEVSAGGTIEVQESVGAVLLEERPQHFRMAHNIAAGDAVGEEER